MPDQPHEPRNLIRLWACVVVGVAIWFSPTPEGLNESAWHLFAVFVAVIASLLLRPLPMGVCVMLGLLVLGSTLTLARYHEITPLVVFSSPWHDSDPKLEWERTAKNQYYLETIETADRVKESFRRSLSGFADTTTWLVVAAFLIAGAVIRTGLGRRIALGLISRLGGSTLGLGYGIALAELSLGPFVPSNTARGGGIMAPIVDSLAKALGAERDGRTSGAGRYLVLVGAHANLIVAAMFLTGMAANPLVAKAAGDVLKVELTWGRWLLGSIVPGLVSLGVLPFVIRWFAGGGLGSQRVAGGDAAAHAREGARTELRAMGRWTGQQIALAVVLAIMLVLWATAPLQKSCLGYVLPTALVALGGVVTLVVLGVEKYRDIIGNAAAWDALIWLGGLITMANALRDTGFTAWFAESVGDYVTGWPAIATAIALALVYFYSMYLFSMLTGHIMALAGAFFAVGLAAGAPPLLLVALVAYFSNLCGCLTNYSTGPVVIYFGLGYVSVGRWFAVGFLMSLVHLIIWLGVGLPYWKALGWW